MNVTMVLFYFILLVKTYTACRYDIKALSKTEISNSE